MVQRARDMPGRFHRQGEVLGYVVEPAARIVRVVVSQTDSELVHRHLRAIEVKRIVCQCLQGGRRCVAFVEGNESGAILPVVTGIGKPQGDLSGCPLRRFRLRLCRQLSVVLVDG